MKLLSIQPGDRVKLTKNIFFNKDNKEYSFYKDDIFTVIEASGISVKIDFNSCKYTIEIDNVSKI